MKNAAKEKFDGCWDLASGMAGLSGKFGETWQKLNLRARGFMGIG